MKSSTSTRPSLRETSREFSHPLAAIDAMNASYQGGTQIAVCGEEIYPDSGTTETR